MVGTFASWSAAQAEIRGTYPSRIVCDKGSEFISHVLDQWAEKRSTNALMKSARMT
jgi:hypothetical protein